MSLRQLQRLRCIAALAVGFGLGSAINSRAVLMLKCEPAVSLFDLLPVAASRIYF